jgi:hypothetical protein
MADMENGLFSGQSPANNPADPTVDYRFLTAIVKGGPNQWAIRGADATTGTLSSFYSGARPTVAGYNPMHKEGMRCFQFPTSSLPDNELTDTQVQEPLSLE